MLFLCGQAYGQTKERYLIFIFNHESRSDGFIHSTDNQAKASAAIENIFTTDDELYKALTYQEDEYVQGPAKEILHCREALWEGFRRIKEEGCVTVDSIIQIYRKVKQTYDGIRPYQAETVIKKRGWGSMIGETVYTQ